MCVTQWSAQECFKIIAVSYFELVIDEQYMGTDKLVFEGEQWGATRKYGKKIRENKVRGKN